MFFVLTIINAPLFVFYITGNKEAYRLPSAESVFARYSIGNLGPTEWQGNNGNETTLYLECPIGMIGDIRIFGRVDGRVEWRDFNLFN